LGHGHLTDPSVDKDGNETPALFTDMCFDITGFEAFNRLIAEGYLLPLIPKRTKLELSVEDLHKQMGEFKESEMQDRFDRAEITEAALREAIEIAHEEDRKHWLIFASGIDHSEHIADMLNSMGISAAAVHSKSSGRDQAIAAFRRGDITAIVNNNVLTTGFDSPHIDLIICLRATSSTVLWVQMMGRGTRPDYAPGFDLEDMGGRLAAIAASGKQDCLVLDYARNTSRLGPINDPVLPMARGKGGGEAPVKLCEFCDTYNHISARVCCNCGNEFSFEVKFKVNASSDQIIKGDLPITKVFEVDHISCDVHHKIERPPSIKVTYYCGLKAFTEYVSPQHSDWAGRKAQRWWKARSDIPMPATTHECLEQIQAIKPATHLRVWINKKYPEIMDFCFDGTAFGTAEATPITPQIESRLLKKPHDPYNYADDLDEDIPF
jgi:DNA repair protein RadD